MPNGTGARAIHSIVFALLDPAALDSDGESVAAASQRLGRLVGQALTNGRSSAEHVLDIDFGTAIAFINSGTALDFVRVLQRLAAGTAGMPIRIGVHVGSLDDSDAHLEGRAVLRQARQIARFAPTGGALASPLFYKFVTQFDHRCKQLLSPAEPVTDAQGRELRAFAIRFDDTAEPAGQFATDDAPRAADPMALPADAEQRLAFLRRSERLLAEEIGPLASLIVRQAAETARTRAGFYRLIGETLPEGTARAEFFRALDRL